MRKPSVSAAAAAPEERRRSGGSTPCCSKSGVKRGPWTPEEDEVLASFVRQEGEGRWRTLPKRAGLRRCGKSCRLRWMNYLRPSIKHGPIAPDEEDLILRLHRLLGNRWSLIAGRIPGRTDNEIKNYWNTHLSKKLIGQGIDPRTHKPLAAAAAAAAASPIPDAIQQPLPPYASPNPSTEFPNPGLNPRVQHNVDDGDDDDHDQDEDNDDGWRKSEFVTDLGDAGIDCYADDIFSAFLDSLINEEMFQLEENHIDNCNNNDAIDHNNLNSISSTGGAGNNNQPAHASATCVPLFGVGSCWEAEFDEQFQQQIPGDAAK